LLYCAALYFFAGSVTGSLFTIRALYVLIGVVLLELFLIAVVRNNVAWGWATLNIVNVQTGYFTGICIRATLERLGYSVPGARTGRLR
jgi:hypothetical protein